jgi:hypothetical protein
LLRLRLANNCCGERGGRRLPLLVFHHATLEIGLRTWLGAVALSRGVIGRGDLSRLFLGAHTPSENHASRR